VCFVECQARDETEPPSNFPHSKNNNGALKISASVLKATKSNNNTKREDKMSEWVGESVL